MPKIIQTHNGYTAFLGPEAPEPDKAWQRLQEVRPTPGKSWFRAYPLSGGAMLVQEGSFTVLRDATEEDRHAAVGALGGRNPARHAILALFGD